MPAVLFYGVRLGLGADRRIQNKKSPDVFVKTRVNSDTTGMTTQIRLSE